MSYRDDLFILNQLDHLLMRTRMSHEMAQDVITLVPIDGIDLDMLERLYPRVNHSSISLDTFCTLKVLCDHVKRSLKDKDLVFFEISGPDFYHLEQAMRFIEKKYRGDNKKK